MGALRENVANAPKASVRERMEQHRKRSQLRLLPRPHGSYRVRARTLRRHRGLSRRLTRGSPSTTARPCPGERRSAGASELRSIPLARRSEFARCLTEKMLTYALGRGLEFSDAVTVREIDQAASDQGYRLGAGPRNRQELSFSLPSKPRREPANTDENDPRRNQPMRKPWALSRRWLLRGGPRPCCSRCSTSCPRATRRGARAAQRPPTRLVFVFFPNGANMEHWTPRTTGPGFELSSTLTPLAQHRANLLVLSGLAHDKARAHGDGPGDHARSNAVFLTGAHPMKTDGQDLRAGVSVDQVAAAQLGRATRFPSLELGCESGGQSGNCDSGYSCAYSSNISWRAPDAPMPNEVNPRQIFERLFGDPHQIIASGDPASQALYRASILDAVLGEARALHPKLSGADRHKMDEYMGSVRAVERQIQLSEKRPGASPGNLAPPTGIPRDTEDYLTLMTDLSALALQSDSTRVLTLTLANKGSNRSFPSLQIADGHHNISHHGKNPEKLEQIRRIDRFYVERFAHLLNRLDGVREMGPHAARVEPGDLRLRHQRRRST